MKDLIIVASTYSDAMNDLADFCNRTNPVFVTGLFGMHTEKGYMIRAKYN